MSIALTLHDAQHDYDGEAECSQCGYELIQHDQWSDPFCPDGCDGIYIDDGGDLINDAGHPPTCQCPGICNPDYYHDLDR